MLAMLYVRTAELEADGERDWSCGLYGKAIALFEPIVATGRLPTDRRAVYERAKQQSRGCRDRG